MANLTPIPNQQPLKSQTGEFQRPTKVQLLRLANNERKIAESTEQQVKSVLKYVFVLLGYTEKDIPDDYEKAVILNFLYNNYGNRFSVLDIKNAFEMAIAGDFDVDKEIYGKRFSPLYLARFMTAYADYKMQMLRRHKLEVVKDEPQEQYKLERSAEEQEEAVYKIIEAYIKNHKNIPMIYDVNTCYNVLLRKGIIMPTNEQNEIKKQNALAKHSAETNRLIMMGKEYASTEKLRLQFIESGMLEVEIKRGYLLDYWGSLLVAYPTSSTGQGH